MLLVKTEENIFFVITAGPIFYGPPWYEYMNTIYRVI